MVYTGYQPVDDPQVRAKFEEAWGVPLDPEMGLTVVEIMAAALEGRVRGMLMMGEQTVAQQMLFHAFGLERHLLVDHLLRSMTDPWTCRACAGN